MDWALGNDCRANFGRYALDAALEVLVKESSPASWQFSTFAFSFIKIYSLLELVQVFLIEAKGALLSLFVMQDDFLLLLVFVVPLCMHASVLTGMWNR